MKHLSLATRYRPQTFAQVAGQDMVKAVLSRAAAEDRPAAAYLLSGTRGVGKTTIARIFAKALNCEHAPGPEPCNECAQCRKITQGGHVDVTEIDGASNNSVEDARSLRETIGYAPMEGRYKIFIIDEAHMLTRNAFNALLKTLEEPPERVVFIFATTEAHKFPVTIVSRCQHFVFRHLSEEALLAHLTAVLQKEGIPFEESALRLIARRAAGSVRDGMSLLDQALALGGESLTAAMTREVLGLAGREVFSRLFDALLERDCGAVAGLCREILRQGIDIGFFTRELAGNLRNLFLLRQGGKAMLQSLQLPADEAALWQELAPRFSAGHLHAAWQMTLDAQRGIVQSPEPAAALELLLLNLALLPQLLPLDCLPDRQADRGPARAEASGSSAVPGASPPPGSENAPAAAPPPQSRGPAASAVPPMPPEEAPAGPKPGAEAAPRSRPEPPSESGPDSGLKQAAPSPLRPEKAGEETQAMPRATAADAPPEQRPAPAAGHAEEHFPTPPGVAAPGFQPDWQAFCEFCAAEQAAGRPAPAQHLLRAARADWQGERLRLTPRAETLLHQLEKQRGALEAALRAYGLREPQLELLAPRPTRSEPELIAEFSKKPELQPCLEVLKASIEHCTEIKS
ncbi:DNA polymerase III subunit gamma/tau [Desulfovibrio sp. ZJ369]|uniref:DNA polymerase III subunit gamma/tau n=1 Tax=Desulfovibrio sp. ZJ369 TaxID=2709793 RepID=UPI0013EB69BC|nr:DNA polymerase III subunit gamma/tau [Desulfovibrio sp. ZJ369]